MIDGVSKQQTKHLAKIYGKDKTEDLKKLNQAMKFRAEYESSLKSDNNVFKKVAERIFLVDYVDQHANRYLNKQTRANCIAVKNKIIDCFGTHTTLAQVDKQFCNKFKDFLIENLAKSANTYFIKFKVILNKAVDEEIISDMPYLKRINISSHESIREFLTEAEIKKINEVNFKYSIVKSAFLFSCYTGLRYVDMANLKFSNIEDSRLRVRMVKTKKDHIMKLHPIALEIIEKQKQDNETEMVFPNLRYPFWEVQVPKLCKLAGITKHITGHCARHTFATRVYRATRDIYLVCKLLGHSSVETTMIYAKMVDEDKDNAIDLLEDIDFLHLANGNGAKEGN
jgi:integrase